MQSMVCGKCGGSWTEPDMLSDELRRAVAATVRTGNMIQAIKQLREVAPLSLGNAKDVVVHITRTPERCHRCKQPLEGAPVSHCIHCRAVNYDW
jgi:ribosomal protein L7/L12